MNTKLSNDLIRNFLTIRYNPNEKPYMKKARWEEFVPRHSDPDGTMTERLLKKSINSSLPKNDQPIAISLSSGIDSTLSLGLLRTVFPKRKLIGICAVFDYGFDESKQAREIANKFDAKFLVVHINSIFKNMPELISIAKKPRWNTYQHYVAKEAKKVSKILINGDGADEIFGGYVFRYHKFFSNISEHDDWKTKTVNYLDSHNRDWVPDQEQVFGKSIKFRWDTIYNYFKPYFSNPLDPLSQVMLADFNGKLIFDFIPTAKKIFKHYDLNGTSIFLHPELMSYALHLQTNQKYDIKNQRGKIVLRKISKRLGIEHIEEKKGFSPDLLIDWNNYGKKITEKILSNEDLYIYKKNIINYKWVIKALDQINSDGDVRYLNRIVSVLALEIFFKIFVEKEINPNSYL